MIWRPWWRRKRKPFASLNEAIRAGHWQHRIDMLDVRGREEVALREARHS